ncbi:hypothetical protein [Klenkia brasiliensis]|uniref:STAS domain-containing protein n=1 Tax=Klenkia brasiliensis TaxID=333142 RepID=A0A1G7VND5_9ACTN|nr:hypothetical protein [Klenkia brasiliensis]SDG61091.1 hypothetical protein SAMN05660324_3136 [Klenkia brasiliensis]
MDGVEVVLRDGGPAAVVTVRGEVRHAVPQLAESLAGALQLAADRPAVVDVSDLWLHRPVAVAVLRGLVRDRPAGAVTVVLARAATRRRLRGLFCAEVAWYPAELRTPWLGVAAALAHRRHQLPADQRAHPVTDPLAELLWAAAQECATHG